MLPAHWPLPFVLITLMCLAQGCAFPGRSTASAESRSSWNPLSAFRRTPSPAEQMAEEEFVVRDPKDPLALKLNYARWMEEAGNAQEARQHYTEVLKARPKDVDAMLGVARSDFSAGQFDLAEQGFRRALKTAPQSAQAMSGLGQCQAARQQWTEAAASLTEASKGLPEDKTIRHQLAIALVHTGDIEAAQLQFSQSVGDAAGHYNTALILKDGGRVAEAEEQLVLALRKNPKMVEAQKWLAELRRTREGASQASPEGPQPIQPAIAQMAYREYDGIGTVTVEPAIHQTDSPGSPIQQASGHSASAPTVHP